MWKLGLVVVVALCTASGCGGSHHARLVTVVGTKDWVAVMNDWLDNTRIDRDHSCGAVVEAVAHTAALEHSLTDGPMPGTYKKAIFAFDSYASNVCTKRPQLSKIAAGMTNGEVAQIAGMPRTPRLHCWLYAVTREHDGRRVCFVNGRATVVQTSNHG